MDTMTAPRLIPLFPLGVVLYPHENLPLHIFEERYKAMIRECLAQDLPFGIVLYDEGIMAEVGCLAMVQRVEQVYEDGRLDIAVDGTDRFRVLEVVDGRAYLQGRIELIEEPEEVVPESLRQRLITQHMKLLELAGRVVNPSRYEGARPLSYMIAQNAGLELRQKQEVLQLATEVERLQYLIAHLESFIPRVREIESLRNKVRSNGHIRDFPPTPTD